MNCWHCGAELIWGGDHDYDHDEENRGIVSNFSCPACPVTVEVWLNLEENRDQTEDLGTVEGFICDICGEEKHGEAFVKTALIACASCFDKGSPPC